LNSCPSKPCFNYCHVFLLFISSLLTFFLRSSYLFFLHFSFLFILLSFGWATFSKLFVLSIKYFFLQTDAYCKCNWFLNL
jgi:hypothetical protein